LERKGKNRQWVEMDWLEYWGRDTERWPQYPGGYYTVTLHDQRQTEAGEQESWKVNSNSYQNGLGDGEWHGMGWLWAYNGVIAYIDGEEVFRITYSEDGVPSCNVRTQVGDTFNNIGAFSYMNQQDLCLYIAGAYDKPLELDYVRIWQGGNAEVEAPKEEDDVPTGDEEFVVDIPAEEFWHNYCTDDWGDPIFSVNEENYMNILAGGEYWDYLTADRKAEINALLKEQGQPSFEELLAAALALGSGEATPTPETGVSTALPAMVAVMAISTAGLWISRKRKK
jgi:LPXTG-motif cell wall-anchored protein